jgi:hypothetical protein
MKMKQAIAGAIIALGLSLTAQAASAGTPGQEASALKPKAEGTFTLVKGWKGGGHHWHHRGGFWWGAPILVYEGSCYSNCRAYRGPRYCHAYCGY